MIHKNFKSWVFVVLLENRHLEVKSREGFEVEEIDI